MSASCLISCTPSKMSLIEHEKNSSPSIEIGDLQTKDEAKGSLTKKANLVEKPELKGSENKVDTAASSKAAHPVESSVIEKDLASLARTLQAARLDALADSMVICTVNGDPITMGDYRRQFKTEQEQVQASLAVNPELSKKLIQMAQEQGVALSLEERKHLAISANKMQAGGSKGFNKMLAENKMTKSQFRDQVFDVGLAFKMAGKLIEDGLLRELISRKLLSQAAKDHGYSKEALNKYTEISKSQQYKRLLQVSGISADDLRNEIITNELCLRQIDKIKKESPITDTEISNYYETNRGKFRHGERIRLSQIFIARTNDISETPLSAKLKLKKENPKLSDSELNRQIAELEKKKSNWQRVY